MPLHPVLPKSESSMVTQPDRNNKAEEMIQSLKRSTHLCEDLSSISELM